MPKGQWLLRNPREIKLQIGAEAPSSDMILNDLWGTKLFYARSEFTERLNRTWEDNSNDKNIDRLARDTLE